MQQTVHRQTQDPSGVFGLPVSVISPYYTGSGAIIENQMKAITGLDFGVSGTGVIGTAFYTGNVLTDAQNLTFDLADATDPADIVTAATSAINAYATTQGYNLSDGIFWASPPATGLPMYVSGVAKSNYYAVVGAPSVAGGAGVARFYIDSNGDGTGTAPSAVFSSSLQAVVWNSTAAYIPQSITVDTNRKYIDVKMGTLNFSTGLAGILSVLTGASIANAANGTTVNCLVLVQQ